MSLHPALSEALSLAVEPRPAPALTCRDTRLPDLPGKVHAVIGMRRSGKTSFLRQLQARWRQTVPPEQALYLSFDDDRLIGIGPEQLSSLVEEFYRRYPDLRGRRRVQWCLDEIHCVPGWERFLRRLLDTEEVGLVVSGSSAQMLSREVHTSLRGRGIETLIMPFSFREALRHRGEEPPADPRRWSPALRSSIEARLLTYLDEGGFPEAQGLDVHTRFRLLQGYVDSVLFRDVVERHAVSQVAALRWLVRHCLRNPASLFSAHRLHQDLRAQGHGVAKDAVHAFLAHLTDAFLISTVPLATESERRRNSNPRKLYPADPGLIHAFETSGRAQRGRALETAVFHELIRRGRDVAYVLTDERLEVDFLARPPGGTEELIQVCTDLSDPQVRERELRAMAAAALQFPQARRLLLVLTHDQATSVSMPGLEVLPVAAWMLERPAVT